MKKFFLLICLILPLLLSCEHSKIDPEWSSHYRCESDGVEFIAHLSIDDVKKNIGKDASLDSLKFDEKLVYEVDAYRYWYYTSYDDDKEIVRASGLMLIPSGAEEVRYVCYCHGTVFPEKSFTDAFHLGSPSDFTGMKGNMDVYQCGVALSSAGFSVAMPDYVGYGPTSGLDHPFIYYPELYKSAVDGFIAGREILTQNEMNPGKDIYLVGWSQGAGLALYIHRLIENNPLYRVLFNLRCTCCLSGPFDVYAFVLDLFNNPSTPRAMIALYAWSCYSINRFHKGLYRKLDQIFRGPIYDQLDAIIMFGISPYDLFNDFFMKRILDGSDTDFINGIRACTTSEGWDPVAPIYLHHGKEDSVVPCFNSVNAYNGLKDRTSSTVELYLYPKQDHTTFVPTFASKVIDELNMNR